ncbi:MAG: acyl carrier protein [Akkermansia sp.]|nr:acyl carrier protein [Akkermansia sp.]
MTIQEFISALSNELDIDSELTPATQFRELPEWSSLSVMELIVLADHEFSKTIKPTDILRCDTVEDLYHLLSA